MERKLIESILLKIRDFSDIKFTFAKNRPENQRTIEELKYTEANIKDVILNLEAVDCLNSFDEDMGGYDGHVFEFGKSIRKKDVYIKFRVMFDEKTCRISCISFHFAKFELKYLFK